MEPQHGRGHGPARADQPAQRNLQTSGYTTIKLQAPGTGRTKTARIWTDVRDERPLRGLLAASLPEIGSKASWPSMVGCRSTGGLVHVEPFA